LKKLELKKKTKDADHMKTSLLLLKEKLDKEMMKRDPERMRGSIAESMRNSIAESLRNPNAIN